MDETTEPQDIPYTEPEAASVEPDEKPVHKRAPRKPKVAEPVEDAEPTAVTPVAPAGPVQTVKLSVIKFKNIYARKSLSVHLVQGRLFDLGYVDAYADKDGWYAEHTRNAVTMFQLHQGLPNTGMMDVKTLQALFAGDTSVTLDLS